MDFLLHLANHKMFVGLAMIMMNLGSRHVIGDLTQVQNEILASELAKKFIVFCMFFIPTRDIIAATMLTFAFFFVIKGIFNEKKDYSILGNETYKDYKDYIAYYDAVKQRI